MSDSALPAPLLPATVNLRAFPRMPLDVARLRASETTVRTKGDEFRCAVLLWCASWHEVPAGSLPNDDTVLADKAGFGRVVREWKRVKTGALRGFVLCSDGRLYHQVVTDIAIDSWGAMLKQRHRSECGKLKKWAQRHKDKKVEIRTFSLWITQECPEAMPYLSRWTKMNVPEDDGGVSSGQGADVPGETASNRIEGIGLPTKNTVSSNTSANSRAVDNPDEGTPRSTPAASAHGSRAASKPAPRRGESQAEYDDRIRTTRTSRAA